MKKWWIIAGALAALLVMGGVAVVQSISSVPTTHEELLKSSAEEFGPAPTMPSTEDLKEELQQLEQSHPEPSITVVPGTDSQALAQPSDEPSESLTGDEAAWEKAELLKQQIVFAEHAPSPMPTGHSSHTSVGQKP